MDISDYRVLCYHPGCSEAATHKIASRWSDGQTHEFKTYYLACRKCASELYAVACRKQASCPVAPDETLDPPVIYEWRRGLRDRQLNPSADHLSDSNSR